MLRMGIFSVDECAADDLTFLIYSGGLKHNCNRVVIVQDPLY